MTLSDLASMSMHISTRPLRQLRHKRISFNNWSTVLDSTLKRHLYTAASTNHTWHPPEPLHTTHSKSKEWLWGSLHTLVRWGQQWDPLPVSPNGPGTPATGSSCAGYWALQGTVVTNGSRKRRCNWTAIPLDPTLIVTYIYKAFSGTETLKYRCALVLHPRCSCYCITESTDTIVTFSGCTFLRPVW